MKSQLMTQPCAWCGQETTREVSPAEKLVVLIFGILCPACKTQEDQARRFLEQEEEENGRENKMV